MAGFSIRRYRSADHAAVRLLFAEGMLGYVPSTCFYLLRLPRVHVFLALSFILLFAISKSCPLSLVGVMVELAAGWCLMKAEFQAYVKRCHGADLQDIEKSYLLKRKCCFWVAEAEGKVIGIVGVQPAPGAEDTLVLRRLSVAKRSRGQGVAKALCKMVIDFGHQHECKQVTLDTSIIQRAAHGLYESLGFEKTEVRYVRTLYGRFADFSVHYYTYTLKQL
ncbi:probable N-acetyltransferase camello [Spea bombifrons]|uniref:probable N-acetyltransferase camello n=1 Tax=Spea bombifrons TaxID=233779 RepID=UPI00234BFB67|nr:probable N-acetyltransferase camello [Spea bombifrons]